MSAEPHDPAENEREPLTEGSESTAFYMWLLITVSAGIIMAQDTWVSLQQPRLSTVDATAAFTKVMVIHAIWLVVTIGFIVFTWWQKPTSAWKVHLVIGGATVIWTIGVLTWSFTDVDRLHVSTWQCESAPTSEMVTEEFLDSCSRADMGVSIRLGGDIFFWSADDEDYWRWIVPGEGLATLQTRWPSQVNAVYLASNSPDATLTAGSLDSVPGGNWSARFDPNESRDLRLFFVESGPSIPIENGTPEPVSSVPFDPRQLYHERFKYTE